MDGLAGRTWPICEVLDPQFVVTLLSLPGFTKLYSGLHSQPSNSCPGDPAQDPPHCWSWMPKTGLQGRGWSQVWLLAQPPLLFIPSVQGGRDQILNVLTAEEGAGVERDGKGKVYTEAKKQRGGGAEAQRL